MKACLLHTAGAIALTFGLGLTLAACVPNAERPTSAPPPAVAIPAPAPPPTPAPPPVVRERQYDNYLDAPQTPGTWSYADDPSETLATFGVGNEFEFVVRCDKSTRQIGLARVTRGGPTSNRAMSIATETMRRELVAAPAGSSNLRIVAASLNPRDPILDAMAITKGRVAIGVEGERTLYLPAWVEISRVIEDCR